MTEPKYSAMSSSFPSETHHADLRQLWADRAYSLKALSEHDRWHLHAYDYGWRRAKLNDWNSVSPIDPAGDWFALHLVVEAHRMYAGKAAPYRYGQAISANQIRPDWRKIPYQHLTRAEREEWDRLDRESSITLPDVHPGRAA